METPAEVCFTLRGTNYRLQLSAQKRASFMISLFDDDLLDRWIGKFTESAIEEITRRAGVPRSASSLWQMLHTAITGTSRDLTFDVVTSDELAHCPGSTHMYVVLCSKTDSDQVRYPLVLHNKPYRPDEWQVVARSLKAENQRLQNRRQAELNHKLESQLCELTKAAKRMDEDRERTIRELKGRIVRLESRPDRPAIVVGRPRSVLEGRRSCPLPLYERNIPCVMMRPRFCELDADRRRIQTLISDHYKY
jgi:hypothetical protein